MPLKIAVAGFRHGHIYEIYNLARNCQEIEIVAACEEDETTREEVARSNLATITHKSFSAMLKETDCDVVAIGDYYGRRGWLIIQSLQAGKHVLSDKPLCTRLEELDEIENLAGARNLKVGCMFSLRGIGSFLTARKLIREGLLGEIQAISFGGQHPLSPGQRPSWYFEPGKHGGTINDLAIHAFDALPWMTGLQFAVVNAARCWNAFVLRYPHFQDGAQMMLTMDNNCGVLGDVSYFLPSSQGYSLPLYWRMTFFGSRGILETSAVSSTVTLYLSGEKEAKILPAGKNFPDVYLQSFLQDLKGKATKEDLDTKKVLLATRVALTVQKAAEENWHQVSLKF